MTSSSEKWLSRTQSSRRERDPLLPRAAQYINALHAGQNDRQPGEHVQDPEVEQRRAFDVRSALNLHRDVLRAVIEDLEDAGAISEDLDEFFKHEKETDDDPYNPCLRPENLVVLLQCWQKRIILLTRWCRETELRWANMDPAAHYTQQRLDDLIYDISQTDFSGPGGGPHDMASHTDVDSGMSPITHNYFCYDGVEWTASVIDITHLNPVSLDDLSDVNAPSPGFNTYLCWDGSEWVPGTIDSGPLVHIRPDQPLARTIEGGDLWMRE